MGHYLGLGGVSLVSSFLEALEIDVYTYSSIVPRFLANFKHLKLWHNYSYISGNQNLKPMKTQKITLATVKKFIRENSGKLFINVKSEFDGTTDATEQRTEGFKEAKATEENKDATLGIVGAWFVGSSRDYFRPYDNIAGDMTGIEVTNSCGRFILAIQK